MRVLKDRNCAVSVKRAVLRPEDIQELIEIVAEEAVRSNWPMDHEPQATSENRFLMYCETAYLKAWRDMS